MLYYHGTSFENLNDILTDGFNPDASRKIWTCSNSGVYFWDAKKLAREEYELDDCSEEYIRDLGKRRAFESAHIAMLHYKSSKCVVFEVEIDGGDVEDDYSCQNMDGAIVVAKAIPPSAIRNIWISDDMSLVRGYFLNIALQNPLFNKCGISKLELKIAKSFEKSEIYPEDIEDNFTLRELDIPLELVMTKIYGHQ